MLIRELMAPVAGFGIDGLASTAEVGVLARRFWDQLVERQLDAIALHMDAGVKQMRLLGESHGLHDLIAGQAQLAQEYMERTFEALRAANELVITVQAGLEGLVKAPRPSAATGITPLEATADPVVQVQR